MNYIPLRLLKYVYGTLILIIILFSSFELKAQFAIKGVITDKMHNALEYASLMLVNDSTNKEINATSDNYGNFIFKQLQPNKYKLISSYLSCESQQIVFHLVKDTTINIQLSDKEINLNEVTISGRKPIIERKIDRLIYNVENQNFITGGDVTEVLRITPGISVKDNQISIIGKSTVSVMIDDRPILLNADELINFLKTINSSQVKTIEVINAPPAKYEAEGNSGIVNIKLKKDSNLGANTILSGTYAIASKSSSNIQISNNFKSKRISYYSGLNSSFGIPFYRTENSEIYYPNQEWNSFSQMSTKEKYNISAREAIDIKISNKISAGIQYVGQGKNNITIDDNITNIKNDFKIDSIIDTKAQSFKKSWIHSLNFHSLYNPKSQGLKISFDLDYFDLINNKNRNSISEKYLEEGNFVENSNVNINSNGKQDISNFSAKLDFQFPYKWMELSYGGKISNTVSNSYFNLSSNLLGNDNDIFNYKEKTQALYVSESNSIGKKFEIQIGVRMEATQTLGVSNKINKSFQNSYYKFFPTFYFLFRPNIDNSISINYNKRINRPYFEILNPFKRYISQYSTTVGNPFLQPSFTDNFEICNNYKSIWMNTLYYSITQNGFEQVQFLSDNIKLKETKTLNFYKSYSMGFNEYYFLKIKKWLESVNTLNISYIETKSFINNTIPNAKSLNGYMSTNNAFILNRSQTIKLNVNYSFYFPGYYLIYKMKARSELDTSLKLYLNNRKIQCSLSFEDILKTMKIANTSYSDDIRIESVNYEDRRLIRLSMVYYFGNSKMAVDKRTNGNEDEINRSKRDIRY